MTSLMFHCVFGMAIKTGF